MPMDAHSHGAHADTRAKTPSERGARGSWVVAIASIRGGISDPLRSSVTRDLVTLAPVRVCASRLARFVS